MLGDLRNSFVKEDISLIVDGDKLAVEYTLVLGGDPDELIDVPTFEARYLVLHSL